MAVARVQVARIARLLGLLMLLSRILGFLRNSIIAALFGQRWVTDTYNAAYILPDTLYLILIGGGVSSAFIPVVSRYLAEDRENEAWEVVSISFNLVLVVFIALIALGLLFTPYYIRILVPGFRNPTQIAYTVLLSRLTLGAVLFNALDGVLFGTQYAYNSMTATGVGPLIYNATIILGGLALSGRYGIAAFAGSVLAGSFLNFLTQLVGVSRLRPRFRWSLNFRHPGVVRIGQLMLPIMLSSSMGQLNLIFNQAVLASFLPHGIINALTISSRIMLLPVSVIGTSLGISLLPTLTGHAVREHRDEFRHFFLTALRAIIFLTIPAATGLMVLSHPIVRILFQHGRFTAENTLVTSQALFYYSIGIVAYAALEIVNRAYYALEDTYTPFKASLAYLAASILLSLVLVETFSYRGLALAYSLSGFVSLSILFFLLRRRLGPLGGRTLALTAFRTVLASLGMALFIIIFRRLWHPTGLLSLVFVRIGLPIAVGVVSFVLFAWLLKAEELSFVLNALRRRRSRMTQA